MELPESFRSMKTQLFLIIWRPSSICTGLFVTFLSFFKHNDSVQTGEQNLTSQRAFRHLLGINIFPWNLNIGFKAMISNFCRMLNSCVFRKVSIDKIRLITVRISNTTFIKLIFDPEVDFKVLWDKFLLRVLFITDVHFDYFLVIDGCVFYHLCNIILQKFISLSVEFY